MSKIDNVPPGKVVGLLAYREGDAIIITDGRGKQYACTNERELWDDMLTILADSTLPKMLVGAAGPRPAGGDAPIDPNELLDAACEGVSALVGEAYGPFFGNLAARVSRRSAPAAVSFLGKISRPSKGKVVP